MEEEVEMEGLGKTLDEYFWVWAALAAFRHRVTSHSESEYYW